MREFASKHEIQRVFPGDSDVASPSMIRGHRDQMVRTSVRNMTLRVFRLDDEAMQRFVLRVARPDVRQWVLDFLEGFLEIYSDL